MEGIGYGMPGYKLHGKPLLYFAGFKEHSFPVCPHQRRFFGALEDKLRGYELRKGTVQFPLTKSVPVKLIARIAKAARGWDHPHGGKTSAGPRERKAQVGPAGRQVGMSVF